MEKITCLIVDDEPIARDIIKQYCAQLPFLEVLATAGNAIEARTLLMQQKTDLLFLDINMPGLDGISFLKSLRNAPQVIFTTAYKEYAIDAFDLHVTDYLLKPFSLERFIIAIDKVVEKRGSAQNIQLSSAVLPNNNNESFFVKADGKIHKLFYNDILFVEASGNYIKIYTIDQMLMPAMTFTQIVQLLPAQLFLRVHRSYLTNKDQISHIEGNTIYTGTYQIPIGSNYKQDFLTALGII